MKIITEFVLGEAEKVVNASYQAIKEVVDEEAQKFYENLYSATPSQKGGLRESLRKEKFEKGSLYGWKIDFMGYNSRGEPYAKIANILNYGSRHINGSGFIDKEKEKLRAINKKIDRRFIILTSRSSKVRGVGENLKIGR